MKFGKAKKFFYGCRVAKTALICILGVPMFFVFSEVPANFIGSYLRVDPSYTGGLVAEEIVDPIGNAGERGGLVRYTVHQPVTGARWQKSAEYWQVVFDFNGAPAKKQETVYIAADNMAESARPWNFALKIDGGQGKVYDSKGALICAAEVYPLNGGEQVKARIPLQDKRLQPLLGAKKTWHSIELGGESVEAGNAGGRAAPVEARMAAQKKKNGQADDDEAFVERVKKIYEAAANNSGASDSSASDDGDPMAAINAALQKYEQKIKENPNDYISLANYGSWLAKKGGESSALKAMKLVKDAYVYLDKAAELCAGKEGEIEVLMNRASVSASIPEMVFKKSEVGANDFTKAASLSDNKVLKAYCHVMAYECYKKCNKESKAFLALQEAKKALE
ncbi:MAG: hypothetical protein VZQ47_11155 [Treponema sp.]|nr:hypothetical protein [Treponema sp.]